MNEIVNIMIAATDLVEAEGRALRWAVTRTIIAAALAVAAVILAAAGIATVIYSFYLAMTRLMPIPLAALVTGLVLLAAAGATLWSTRKVIR